LPKLAFVFPGQGSQEVGIGKDLIKNYIKKPMNYLMKLI
jgi:malonyl CoA-acyl carrier protein transacylase